MKHINWAYENENSLHTSHVEQTERQTDGRTDSQTHPYFDHFQNFIRYICENDMTRSLNNKCLNA